MIRTSVLTASLLVSLSSSFFAQAASPTKPNITEAELLHRTQQLYDAANVGDSKPWDAYFASDAMVFDEKGHSLDKKGLLADTTPLPAGYAVHLTVVHPHIIIAPGAAMVGYECEETETVFGQQLHARYHTVDTWLYRQSRWQIAAAVLIIAKTKDGGHTVGEDSDCGAVMRASLFDPALTQRLTTVLDQ